MKFIDINYFKKLKTDEDIENYVKNRLNYLEKKSEKKLISALTGIKSGYITKDSPIHASLIFSSPFYLDDFNLYVKFVKHLKQFNREKSSENIIDLDVFTLICSMFVIDLFYDSSKKTIDRHDLYDLKAELSIRDFYKNGSAKCIEKSAVMHNLLCFLGIPSNLIIGELKLKGEEEGEELHAYNIVNDPKKNLWLVDFTNYVKVINKAGIKTTVPTLMKLNTQDINELDIINVDSESVARAYEHYNFKKDLNDKKRVYTMPQSFLCSTKKKSLK